MQAKIQNSNTNITTFTGNQRNFLKNTLVFKLKRTCIYKKTQVRFKLLVEFSFSTLHSFHSDNKSSPRSQMHCQTCIFISMNLF